MKTTLFAFLSLFFLMIARPERAFAGESKCFPTCRSGFVCSPQGQCVSACNPVCSSEQTCSDLGECIDKSPLSKAPEKADASRVKEPPGKEPPAKSGPPTKDDAGEQVQEPPRPFELTFGLGAQKALGSGDAAEWGVTPELAFLYTLNAGRPAELFLGFRARFNATASVPGFGPEFGVRGGLASSTGFVRGGLFVSAGPEVVLGKLTRNQFQGALAIRASAGPYIDVGPLVARLPVAIEGAYVLDSTASQRGLGLLMVSGEVGVRF